MRYFKFCLGFFFVSLIFPNEVVAYLDPGTGSYIVQLLIGMLAGVLFAVKIFWHKIRGFVEEKIFRVKKRNDREGK